MRDADKDISHISTEWKREISAIHFGVKLDKAAQVLLEDPIKIAIGDKDDQEFLNLSAITGFGEVFEYLTHSFIAANNDRPLAQSTAIEYIRMFNKIEECDEQWQSQSWNNLYQYYRYNFEHDLSSPLNTALISCFFGRLNENKNQEFINTTARKLSEAISTSNVIKISDLAKSAESIIEFARSNELETPIFDLSELSIETFLRRINIFAKNDKTLNCVSAHQNWDDVQNGIATLLEDDTHAWHAPAVIPRLTSGRASNVSGLELDEIENWSKVLDTVKTIIADPESAPNKYRAALGVIGSLILINQENVRNLCEMIIANNTIRAKLNAAKANDDIDSMSSIFAILIWYGEDFAPPDGFTWKDTLSSASNLADSTVNKLRKFLNNEIVEPVWNLRKQATGSKEFLASIIRMMVNGGSLGTLNTKKITEELNIYLAFVPYELKKDFVALLSTCDSFWSRLENNPIDSNLRQLADQIALNSKDDALRAKAIMLARLRSCSIASWFGAIKSRTEPFGFTTEFIEVGMFNEGVRSNLFKALDAKMETVIKETNREYRINWFSLSQYLNPRARKKLFSKIGPSIFHSKTAGSELKLLKIGGEELVQLGGFSKSPDLAVQNIILCQLNNKHGRQWLKSVQSETKSWVSKSTETTRENLRNKLDEFIKGKVGEKTYWAETMKSLWKL